MRERSILGFPNRDGAEECIRMNPDYSAGIYVTASVESQYRLISQNQKMKEEEKIKNTKVNFPKRAARMYQRAELSAKSFSSLPKEMMASEYPSTPLLLQVPLSLSADIIKDSNQNLCGKMDELPDLKKRTVAAAIVRKWGERIRVMVRDACVS